MAQPMSTACGAARRALILVLVAALGFLFRVAALGFFFLVAALGFSIFLPKVNFEIKKMFFFFTYSACGCRLE
jgi:hypothetical protein